MDIGLTCFNTDREVPPPEVARLVEERGYESLWYPEHSHIPRCRRSPYPLGPDLPEMYTRMMDPYVSLTMAAAVTTTLKLGTAIALLMERELISQAKTIATLDRLSNGRVIIGAGVGWNEEEFSNANNNPFARRYSVLKETVAATRKLWQEEAPEYHGEFIDFDPVWMEPKPVQPGGPKVYLGVLGPVGLKHTAQWADGWLPVDSGLVDVGKSVSSFRARVAETGRDVDSVDITIISVRGVTLDKLKYYRDLGIKRVIISHDIEDWDRPDTIKWTIDRYATMIPQIN